LLSEYSRWTSNPTKWDNKYFRYLVDYEWEPHKGPGGHWQWRINGTDDAPVAPVADPHSDDVQPVMMLTTDVALSVDPEYRQYVEEFAEDEEAFTEAFAKAWYKLVTRDIVRTIVERFRDEKWSHGDSYLF
jgi:catalase-peroxidase